MNSRHKRCPVLYYIMHNQLSYLDGLSDYTYKMNV
jgi:hypothetical protein